MTREFDNDEYRNRWLESYVKHHIAAQFRALRGDTTQVQFGKKIAASQSMVARYESPSYGSMTLNTLLDIAKRLRLGLQVRFVPFTTVTDQAKNLSSEDLAPAAYDVAMKIRDSRAVLRQTPGDPRFLAGENRVSRYRYREPAFPLPDTAGNDAATSRPSTQPINLPGLPGGPKVQPHPRQVN